MKKLRMLLLVVIVVLVVAPVASACEICKAYDVDWYGCYSGVAVGFQWCYGGFGEDCHLGDRCPGHSMQQEPSPQVGENACAGGALGCAQPGLEDAGPEDGLTLEQ